MCFQKLGKLAFLAGLCFPLWASAITFNGATTYQTMDGIGVNLNYRGWEGANLVPVLNAYIEQAGASLFRVTFDLSDWEAVNDDTNSNTFNWDYYNPIYSSPEFTRLWDMIEYLNGRGFTNRVCLAFMGWGPAWMMEADGRSLKAGMEDEWAEMMASVLIYARNTRGLNLSLVTPNNEPDILDEGIKVPTANQYTNTLHRLVTKLDAAGITNLWFVGPDLSKSATAYLPEMLASPTIMSRVKHFGVHTYSASSAASDAKGIVQNYPAYADRTVWVTEYNVWCETCDDGVLPSLDWIYTRGTAEYLLNHLQRDATAALAWEGYDSVYAHHYTNWGFFGLIGVDDTNALVKTYTPRKNFFTTAQISKWVRPGAQRISVSSQGPFTYLAAFKHDALGQVTIVGVNSGGSTTLTGPLTNLPPVPELVLTYTTEFTNQAAGGVAAVNGGNFSIGIPANSVFTLTGFMAKPLTNGVARAGGNAVPGTLDHYYLNLTNPVARAQFEVIAPSTDVTLIVEKGQPSDGVNFVQYSSANAGTNAEMLVLRPGNGPKTLAAGLWYLSVLNVSGTNAAYSVKATQWDVSGVPLIVHAFSLGPNEACLEWNTVPGAAYVVEGKSDASAGAWTDVSGTLVASASTNTFCVPLPNPFRFFRVLEGISVSTP